MNRQRRRRYNTKEGIKWKYVTLYYYITIFILFCLFCIYLKYIIYMNIYRIECKHIYSLKEFIIQAVNIKRKQILLQILVTHRYMYIYCICVCIHLCIHICVCIYTHTNIHCIFVSLNETLKHVSTHCF